MPKLTFEKTKTTGTMALGNLTWGTKSYTARSGGYGKGQLPDGEYVVKVRHVVDTGLASGFKTGKTEFFIPLQARFTTNRSGLGIHPDGNSAGTLGCIGLPANDAARFWKDWTSIQLSQRPTSLTVKLSAAKRYRLLSAVKDVSLKKALQHALRGDGKISDDEVRMILKSTLDGNGVTRQESADLSAILSGSRSLTPKSRNLIQQFLRNPRSVKL